MKHEHSRKRKILFTAAGVTTVVFIVIIVLAATLSGRHAKKEKTSILVPLYIFPGAGAWDPLFEAFVADSLYSLYRQVLTMYHSIAAHPRTNFTVVINPNSGPIVADKLDQRYKASIQRLDAFPNVRTIGYISTNYGQRDMSQVLADMSTYTGWGPASANGTFGVHGIFFDEVVSNHTDSNGDYMATADRAVKSSAEFKPRQMVIHNNGVIPTYTQDSTTDLAIVFEGTYQQYQERQPDISALGKDDRARRCFLVHSLPPGADLKKMVAEMKPFAGSLFMTELSEDYYQKFGTTWREFVDAVASS